MRETRVLVVCGAERFLVDERATGLGCPRSRKHRLEHSVFRGTASREWEGFRGGLVVQLVCVDAGLVSGAVDDDHFIADPVDLVSWRDVFGAFRRVVVHWGFVVIVIHLLSLLC